MKAFYCPNRKMCDKENFFFFFKCRRSYTGDFGEIKKMNVTDRAGICAQYTVRLILLYLEDAVCHRSIDCFSTILYKFAVFGSHGNTFVLQLEDNAA